MYRQGLVNIDDTEYSGGAGAGFLRVVLLFGSAAVSLGLILIPLLLAQQSDRQLVNTLSINTMDQMVTGSVKLDSSLKLPLDSSISEH